MTQRRYQFLLVLLVWGLGSILTTLTILAPPVEAFREGQREGQLTTTTPQGHVLESSLVLQYKEKGDLIKLFLPGRAQGYLYVNETYNQFAWLSFRYFSDEENFWWPSGQGLTLVFKDGLTLPASELYVMTPPFEQRLIPLGRAPLRIPADRLWRNTAEGGTYIIIFAAFPRGLKVGDRTINWSFNDAASVLVTPATSLSLKPEP